MVFSSVIFLFFFLPLVLSAHAVAGSRLRNSVLLGASLLFYGWGEGLYVILLLLSTGVNYWCGLFLHKGGRWRIPGLVAGLTFNLGLLFVLKYGDFAIENTNLALQLFSLSPWASQEFHLPIGISFFTFQAISYLLDIHAGRSAVQRNPIHLGLYLSMFPQLIAGPIIRYNTISEQLEQRSITLSDCSNGIRRFITGLAKKIVLADSLAEVADLCFSLPNGELSFSLAWLGVVCYSLQIFYDFSGYSDMAIGLGRMFGFHYQENFNYPYISRSMRDFWRRWHISLSTWFRDYLYIPLGGNRKGGLRTHIHLLVVFFLCGLWHGASWTFVVWGCYHGFFLILERTLFGEWMSRWWRPFQHIWCLLVIMVGWVIFRCESLPQAWGYLSVMLGVRGGHDTQLLTSMLFASKTQVELIAALLFSTPIFPVLWEWWRKRRLQLHGSVLKIGETVVSTTYFLLLMMVFYLAVITLAARVYTPFIYFRF